MKYPMNLALASAAVLLMGGVSAHAATTAAKANPQNLDAVCATMAGSQDPACQKFSNDGKANMDRWGRWHRGGWRRGWGWGWGRGWRGGRFCYWHPYAC